jgi:hypothetical protein
MQKKEEEIYKKIEEIYGQEKGKNFITHLLRSFLPINRSKFMFELNKDKKMICAITGSRLICRAEVMKFQLDNVDVILKNFSDRLLQKTTENVVIDNFKGKFMAIECESSNRLLTLTAVEQLFNFSATELLKGNKHIEFVLRDEQKKEMAKTKTETDSEHYSEWNKIKTLYPTDEIKPKKFNLKTPEKFKTEKPKYEKPKETKEVSTFGDLAALQELKKKLEEAGN